MMAMETKSRYKISIGDIEIWMPVKSTLLHGVIQISLFKEELFIYDLILGLVNRGFDIDSQDIENKTAFNIFAEGFLHYDINEFSLGRNNLIFRLKLEIFKQMAMKNFRVNSTPGWSYKFYLSFMEEGKKKWLEFKREAELIYGKSDFVSICPFEIDGKFDDSVKEDDLMNFFQMVSTVYKDKTT